MRLTNFIACFLLLFLLVGCSENSSSTKTSKHTKTVTPKKPQGSDHTKKVERNVKRKFGGTKLTNAVLNENHSRVRELLNKGADVNQRGKKGLAPLHRAVLDGDSHMVRILLEHGADVDAIYDTSNQEGGGKTTALRMATYQGDKNIVKLLIKHGANVNFSTDKPGGVPPLIAAAVTGHYEITKLLLENGANVDAVDQQGRTAFDWAKKRGHDEVARLIKSYI